MCEGTNRAVAEGGIRGRDQSVCAPCIHRRQLPGNQHGGRRDRGRENALARPREDNYDRHSSVSWNRVRDTIIFSTRNAATAEKYHDIFALDPHTKTVKRLTDHRDTAKNNDFLAWPVVSPDGTKIATVHMSRDLEQPPRDIWILNQDGTVLKTLHATGQQYCGPTSWSADGEYLYYSASDEPDVQRDLYRIRVEDDQREQLTCGEADDVDPDICPRR